LEKQILQMPGKEWVPFGPYSELCDVGDQSAQIRNLVSPYTGYPPILLLRQHSCVLSILPFATDNYLTAQAVFGCNLLRELVM
jgi:hypothetical protein